MDRNTETVNKHFFGCTGGILRTQELFPMAYFTHNPTCSWALGICKYNRIRTYFGLVTAKCVGFCGPFACCIKVPRLATFSIAPKNCIFGGASFEPIKNLATLDTNKLQGFHGTPLHHCYTLALSVRRST